MPFVLRCSLLAVRAVARCDAASMTEVDSVQMPARVRTRGAGVRGEPLLSFAFTGKEDDPEVGLTYFGKRYLIPALGTWASPDPLAVHAPGKADLNLYAYVKGQMLRATDPTGLEDKGARADAIEYGRQMVSEQLQRGVMAMEKAGLPTGVVQAVISQAKSIDTRASMSSWTPGTKELALKSGVAEDFSKGKANAVGTVVHEAEHAEIERNPAAPWVKAGEASFARQIAALPAGHPLRGADVHHAFQEAAAYAGDRASAWLGARDSLEQRKRAGTLNESIVKSTARDDERDIQAADRAGVVHLGVRATEVQVTLELPREAKDHLNASALGGKVTDKLADSPELQEAAKTGDK